MSLIFVVRGDEIVEEETTENKTKNRRRLLRRSFDNCLPCLALIRVRKNCFVLATFWQLLSNLNGGNKRLLIFWVEVEATVFPFENCLILPKIRSHKKVSPSEKRETAFYLKRKQSGSYRKRPCSKKGRAKEKTRLWFGKWQQKTKPQSVETTKGEEEEEEERKRSKKQATISSSSSSRFSLGAEAIILGEKCCEGRRRKDCWARTAVISIPNCSQKPFW